MNKTPLKDPGASVKWGGAILVVVVLSLLFWRSLLPDFVHFSNDGPLGQQMLSYAQLPGAVLGAWGDSNFIGSSGGTYTPSLSLIFLWLAGPVGYAKFLAPFALTILGLGAWFFFRALKLSPLAAALGTLAAMLNSTFFATACWGVASQQIAMGLDFFALALIVGGRPDQPLLIRGSRLALAGFCVGLNVIEAADIGVLCSLMVALFVVIHAWATEEGGAAKRTLWGVCRVAVVAVFAGFIAFQAVKSLAGANLHAAPGAAQSSESKLQHWDWATQWSLPKKETLALVVPGLFGYKMDTPKDMMPRFAEAYNGGVYWGGTGRDPALDRFLDAGGEGSAPSGLMRFTGGGNYCGILVMLVALWAAAQSFRRQNSVFPDAQKRLIWFWILVLIVSLPLAWGRFAPLSKSSDDFMFYALLYKLPYFSSIRNPSKFINFFSWAVVILFAYGIHGLSRRYLNPAAGLSAGPMAQLKNWWAKSDAFDRKWVWFSAGVLGASVLGALIYYSRKSELVDYLQHMGFSDSKLAEQIAGFSLAQTGWFLLLLAVALVLVALTLAGYFSGKRARTGMFLLGAFLLFDMVRADLPYIVHWDYKQKYDVSAENTGGSSNAILEFLRDKPYEHRVAKLLPAPFTTPSEFGTFDSLYEIEWKQHQFLYYGIQCLDVIQMARLADDVAAYEGALRVGIKQNPDGQYMLDETTFPRLARKWELTNTRYLLGPAPFLNLFNSQFDPKGRFRIVKLFTVGLKPGVTEFHQRLEEITAFPKTDGEYALFEFTAALPRAALYASWQVNTNDADNLKTLADPAFDPARTVLVSTPQPGLATAATNENTGSVEITRYKPKTKVFDADVRVPSVLLFNDSYAPDWHVTVDGQPAPLLRCNYIMRGVYLPAPGKHTVVFTYEMSHWPLYVTVTAMALGLCLCGILAFDRWKRRTGLAS